MLVFSLVLWASDSKNQIVSSIGLFVITLAVLLAHAFNRYAVRRFRATRRQAGAGMVAL